MATPATRGSCRMRGRTVVTKRCWCSAPVVVLNWELTLRSLAPLRGAPKVTFSCVVSSGVGPRGWLRRRAQEGLDQRRARGVVGAARRTRVQEIESERRKRASVLRAENVLAAPRLVGAMLSIASGRDPAEPLALGRRPHHQRGGGVSDVTDAGTAKSRSTPPAWPAGEPCDRVWSTISRIRRWPPSS
jgi:hypothetical protein